jgi:hypothetical protein
MTKKNAVRTYISCLALWSVLAVNPAAQATLTVQMDEPQWTGSKAIVKLSMRNTYTNSVQSARVAVFLLDEKGKVVGQKAQWVIGGNKEKPSLASEASTKFYVVIPAEKPFKKAKVTFTRIILEDGRVIEAGKGYRME